MGSIRGAAFSGALGSARPRRLRAEILSVLSLRSVSEGGSLVSAFFSSFGGGVGGGTLRAVVRGSRILVAGAGSGLFSSRGGAETVATRAVVVRIGARSSAGLGAGALTSTFGTER